MKWDADKILFYTLRHGKGAGLPQDENWGEGGKGRVITRCKRKFCPSDSLPLELFYDDVARTVPLPKPPLFPPCAVNDAELLLPLFRICGAVVAVVTGASVW